ncbi:MAG: 2-C-methyl-D-erythritol 4-phosphate cytidylyltransferase [Bacteroidetes bacterium]|nr:2-C-methyl-D-erythritol 4-phosphate cytidylyltransferase [Bacteroidota bacterium]
MNISAIIPAGGTGTRMNNELPKQFIKINNIPIIIHTIKLFDTVDGIKSIVITIHCEWLDYAKELVKKFSCNKVKDILVGGKERQDSVNIAINNDYIKDSDLVLVHDAVRPFTSKKMIYELIETATDCGAAIPIIKPTDSIKQIDNNGNVLKTLDREHIGLVQTPQVYKTSLLIAAYQKAYNSGYKGTDDSSLIEFSGYNVKYITGELNNIKITSPLDLQLANILYAKEFR